MEEVIEQYRPAVWWILTRVYHHLLKNRPIRTVLPVPEASMDAKELHCTDVMGDEWPKFISGISPANGPSDASAADEVEKAIMDTARVDRVTAQLLLQGKGFERSRSKTRGHNGYYYKYVFTQGGVKMLKSAYVKM